MPQQDPDTVPVTMLDVSSHFSGEEWKLLHDWQKDLYRNVMNEIHQALVSLGPLIVTTVFSLRAGEKEDLRPLATQESEGMPTDNHSPAGGVVANSDAPFCTKRERSHYRRTPQGAGLRTSDDYFSTDCSLALHTDSLHWTPQKEDLNWRNLSGSEGSEISHRPHTGYPLLNADMYGGNEDEPQSPLVDDSERGVDSISPGSGAAVISFIIKDEDEPSSVDCWDSKTRGIIDAPRASDKSMNTQKKARSCERKRLNIRELAVELVSPEWLDARSRCRQVCQRLLGNQERFAHRPAACQSVGVSVANLDALHIGRTHGYPGVPTLPWEDWIEMLENYIVALDGQGFSSLRKKAILLSTLGCEGQRIFKYLPPSMGPNGQPMDDVFKEAIKRLENRFAKETNLVLARYKFYTQPQDFHESIDDFVSRLRELSVKCRFGTMTDELIRDQLIVQCRDKKIQERLWAAKDPTLQEAIDLAKVIEESRRCIKEIERKEKTGEVMVLSSESTGSQQELGTVPKKVGGTGY
ncbi:hypothetical protein NDU88_000106 [Pleurodeles waltl]|uniref:KRAB domain-containing protein n=1 Tax=Pleurodeles waltl TaxID=8319 RepID=A0AAV7U4F3_PLEWA|nr:hypothetical protein NDU88_000106 [Pleurodeles waltl]